MVIDGNGTDIATIAVAFFYALLRCLRNSPSLEAFVSDVSYGLSLYPMILLSLVFLSSWAMQELQKSNKVLMSFAGVISLVVLVRRSFEQKRASGWN